MATGSIPVTSPRFAGLTVSTVISETSGSVPASDGSVVSVTEAPPASLRIDLRETSGGAAIISRVIADNDAELLAALARVLS